MLREQTTVGSIRHARSPALGPAVLLGLVSLLIMAAPAAQATFGLQSVSTAFTAQGGDLGAQAAGSHPEAWSTTLAFNTIGAPGSEHPDGAVKDLHITLPPGLVGSPALLPECAHTDYVDDACPESTAVGTVSLNISQPLPVLPVYLLEPLAGQAAQLGFHVLQVSVTIDLSISPRPPHNLVASITNVSQIADLFGTVLTIDGAPNDNPFLTLPRSCPDPLQSTFSVASWQAPATLVPASSPDPQIVTDCGALAYAPALAVQPTTSQAAAPSGLDLTLDAPDEGLASPGGRAHADTERAVLHLPAGMTVNPPVAAGLAACDPAQLAAETPGGAPGDGCPQASKLGSAKVQTPLFAKPLAGTIYLAKPDDPATATAGAENPFDTLLALHLVIEDPERGVLLAMPIAIAADPGTGRLTATLDQIPQFPISRLELHFNSGPHAPLTTPGGCGSETIAYALTPSSGNAPLRGGDSFTTTGNCAPRFAPTLAAGTSNPVAGRSSSFVLDLSQASGEENLSRLSLNLPPGLSADFAAVRRCPEALAAAGRCPADSRVGFARIAAGNGATPLWIPEAGRAPSAVYLAGPYAGGAVSLVVVVPAQAGPFDLGTFVTRAAITVDPETAQARIDLDPLPQVLKGIPVAYRTVRVVLDRAGFIRNPTSCAAAAVQASVESTAGTTAVASNGFQVGDCGLLGFRPRVTVHLLGPTGRGSHPRLRAVVKARPGDANVRGAGFTLPAAELLDSRHIRKVCTRAEFAAGHCPASSAYGRVRAWTPLLGRPLSGRVFLRESDNKLPDLAVALGGEVDLELSGRIDSSHGRLRIALQRLPDVPLSKVVLNMPGGKRGLLANTGGLCARRWRAGGSFNAQNGKRHNLHPVVKTDCGKRGNR